MAAAAENKSSSSSSSSSEIEYQSDAKKLADLFSKLNPSAKEFVPSYKLNNSNGVLSADAPLFVASTDLQTIGFSNLENNNLNRRRKNVNGNYQGRRRMNERMRSSEREDKIRRTVYVSDVDQFITEEYLADLFANCGHVNDVRVCVDPHSHLQFAFIEFADEDGAKEALNLGGCMLGYYPIRVLPSKTAILPVNPRFLPKSSNEREMVLRTVYCTNIDKMVTQDDIKSFFEHTCGEVSNLRLLGDTVHSTHIAFVEFVWAQSALTALNCSGVLLGSLPIRVSPSKTPVKPRTRFPRSVSQ